MQPDHGRFEIREVAWADERAEQLRQLMSAELNARYAHVAATYSREQLDALERALIVDPATIRHTVLAVAHDGEPLGLAALRDLAGEWEVKRVIVATAARGRGVGRALMEAVEALARTGGAARVVLQTGDRQPEAIALYERLGYHRVEIYPPYAGAVPFSVCFAKALTSSRATPNQGEPAGELAC